MARSLVNVPEGDCQEGDQAVEAAVEMILGVV